MKNAMNPETEALRLYFGKQLKDINSPEEAKEMIHKWIDVKEKDSNKMYIKLAAKGLRQRIDDLVDYDALCR
jgi:hypothetical protein